MRILTAVAIVGLSIKSLAVASELHSGLQAGDTANYFEVRDCTGPAAGNRLCYRCRLGSRPVVSIFTRTLTDDLAHLIKSVDSQVERNKENGLAGFVVLLTDDPVAAESMLIQFARKHDIRNVPLTCFDGIAGPPSYRIAGKADITVNMWVDQTLRVNHAFSAGRLNEAAVSRVIADTSKILQ